MIDKYGIALIRFENSRSPFLPWGSEVYEVLAVVRNKAYNDDKTARRVIGRVETDIGRYGRLEEGKRKLPSLPKSYQLENGNWIMYSYDSLPIIDGLCGFYRGDRVYKRLASPNIQVKDHPERFLTMNEPWPNGEMKYIEWGDRSEYRDEKTPLG